MAEDPKIILQTQKGITDEIKKQRDELSQLIVGSVEYESTLKRVAKLEAQKAQIIKEQKESAQDAGNDQLSFADRLNKLLSDRKSKIEKLSKSETIGSTLQKNATENQVSLLKSLNQQKSLTASAQGETNEATEATFASLQKLIEAAGNRQQIQEQITASQNRQKDLSEEFQPLLLANEQAFEMIAQEASKAAEFQESFGEAIEKNVSRAKKLASFIAGLGIIASITKIAKDFGATIDKIGETFGSLTNLGQEFQSDLLDASVEATALGGGIEDVAAITSTLASNFGVSLDDAAQLSSKIFDTSKALGISSDEASNLFGTLMQTANLSADQAEKLSEGAAQLARQRGVAPNAVLKDLAQSAETIAEFTKDGGDNIAEAAVQARILGVSLDTTAKISKGLLDFESSINNEIEASVMIGKQLNFQKARQLALEGDIAGATKEVVSQLGSEAEFNKLNVLQRESLAKSIGVSTAELTKLVGQSDKLSLSGALAAGNFEDLLGEDAISNISNIINQFKALGAQLIRELGPTIENVIGQFSDFVTEGGGLDAIKGIISGIGSALQFVAGNLPTVIGLMVAFKTASLAAATAQTLLAVSKTAALTAGIGIPVVLGLIAAGMASAMTAVPELEEGGVVTGTGMAQVHKGEVFSGTNNQMGFGMGNVDALVEATKETTRAISNLNITAGRGEIRVAMEPQMGGNL